MIAMNDDQRRAMKEIIAAVAPRAKHLLTGFAGSGKTWLMQTFAREMKARGKSVALTAPTHKAVEVLKRKVREAGLDVDCMTIQSLLSLYPKVQEDRQIFVRRKHARPVMYDVVVIDECSMLSEDLMKHIRIHLPVSFVLFVGDPAQLPPVGEIASQSFSTRSRSHLETIVRQGADNPVLRAADIIRRSQGGPMDWSWAKPNMQKPLGVYVPDNSDRWLHKAFTSKEFDENPDRFRYMAWTNERVSQVNDKIRRWRYGDDVKTPFVVGERALLQSPIVINEVILFNNNEEATVRGIKASTYRQRIPSGLRAQGWVAEMPAWRVSLQRDGSDDIIDVHMAADVKAQNAVIDQIKSEAIKGDPERWKTLQELTSGLARLQSIYALTVHKSQGSTFTNAFIDIPNIRRLAAEDPLECQKMLYVAATRPTDALVLVGA